MEDRPSVLLAVEPLLLADTLTVVLETHGWDVARAPVEDRRSAPRTPARRFDLAIVSRAPPSDTAPDLVLEIQANGSLNAVNDKGENVDLLTAVREVATSGRD